MTRLTAILLVAAGCGSPPAGHLPGATHFVALPMPLEVLPIVDSDGVSVSENGRPDAAPCVKACAAAVPAGSHVIGCRTADATRSATDALRLTSNKLLLCELP